ncbi:hypothetical protein P7K49_012210 [Saguinus oedipus]|uniref:Uncharacterized protein n=1 Tax=Saguinus oedipus TaxID=9490 RepID=A0ABQ9VV73_SAGOE|nr:hypothetical protein P7K49_012210 [Saguinus oedipus]
MWPRSLVFSEDPVSEHSLVASWASLEGAAEAEHSVTLSRARRFQLAHNLRAGVPWTAMQSPSLSLRVRSWRTHTARVGIPHSVTPVLTALS